MALLYIASISTPSSSMASADLIQECHVTHVYTGTDTLYADDHNQYKRKKAQDARTKRMLKELGVKLVNNWYIYD